MPQYCPHCEHEIDHLAYRASYSEYGSEYGTCNTDGNDHECEDRSSDDGDTEEYEYSCPECEHALDPDEVVDTLEENDDENDEDIEVELEAGSDNEDVLDDEAEVVRPPLSAYINTNQQRKFSSSIECPECHHIVFRAMNESAICENCNHEIE